MAYADYMFYFEDDRPRRKRPYSQKSLRKFDHRRRADDEHYCRVMCADFSIEFTYANRVSKMAQLSSSWRRMLSCSGKSYALSYVYPRIHAISRYYPPCPLPD